MTPEEAREAIAGRHHLSVFFVDETPARRMGRASSGVSLDLPADAKLIGEVVRLERGAYSLPLIGGRMQVCVIDRLAQLADLDHRPLGRGFMRGVVVERDGVRYLLHESAGTAPDGRPQHRPSRALPASATIEVVKEHRVGETAAEKRQRERYEACVTAGLPMPTDVHSHLPRGVGRVAKDLGITTPALSEDLKKHLERMQRLQAK